jgi:hypothetical protein
MKPNNAAFLLGMLATGSRRVASCLGVLLLGLLASVGALAASPSAERRV